MQWKDENGNTCYGVKPELWINVPLPAEKGEDELSKAIKSDEEGVEDELSKAIKSNRRRRPGEKSK